MVRLSANFDATGCTPRVEEVAHYLAVPITWIQWLGPFDRSGCVKTFVESGRMPESAVLFAVTKYSTTLSS